MRCVPWPPTRSRGRGRGCADWLRHPVPHLGSGYRPPNNEPCALQSQTKATPSLARKERAQVPPCSAGSRRRLYLPRAHGDTQGPSFTPLLLNELEAGQGPRGKPGLGLGGVSWCACGPWPVQGPPSPPPSQGEGTADTMGIGILQGDHRTPMSFKFTVFKHVSYSNFSQELFTESQDSFYSPQENVSA